MKALGFQQTKKVSPTVEFSGSENGFTLIEVLIALAIFSIGILAVAGMQITAVNSNSTASRLTTSLTWAADQVERVIALPYDHADLNPGNHTPATGSDGIDNDSDGLIDESGETGVTYVSWNVVENDPILNIKNIQFTVDYQDRGRARSAFLDYYKMKDF